MTTTDIVGIEKAILTPLPPQFVYEYLRAEADNIVGIIIEDGQVIIGMLDDKGIVKRLHDPIPLEDIEKGEASMLEALKSIPLARGFTEADKQRLQTLFSGFEEAARGQSESKYTMYVQMSDKKYSELSNKYDAVIKETEDRNEEIQLLKKNVVEMESAKATLLKDSKDILAKLEQCKQDSLTRMQNQNIGQFESDIDLAKLKDSNKVLQDKLDALLRSEQEHTGLTAKKDEEISNLTKNVEDIKTKLNEVTSELESSKKSCIANEQRCVDVILKQKKRIIADLKQTHDKWKEWSVNITSDVEKYKTAVLSEYRIIYDSMNQIAERANKSSAKKNTEIRRLKQNINDLQLELQKVVAEQVTRLHEKDEELKRANEQDQSEQLEEKNAQIVELQRELEEVRKMLFANEKTKVPEVDYTKCFAVLNSLSALNNVFYRKQEIIQRLDAIIKNNDTAFQNMTQAMKEDITSRFEKVKAEIISHVMFLDVKSFMDSSNFVHLKNKATHSKVDPEYCVSVSNLLEYWNENKAHYMEQDRQLTNIYEDLSGAVRVYVRVKPLVGTEQKEKTIGITSIDDRKQRSVFLDCSSVQDAKNNVKQTFGDFYGVFEDVFTNLDVYTGLQDTAQVMPVDNLKVNVDDIVEKSDTASPGLYNAFRQVEDGYSIVLMGYGLSGSGKTFTLLGSNGLQGSTYPGLLHYGLANLRGIKTIGLKYLFEQYYKDIEPNMMLIRGKIHYLLGEPKGMVPDDYRSDERSSFKQAIPAGINVNNLKVEDLYELTEAIEKYRINAHRIKKTPNNPVSSRSNLFMVFEVMFDNNKTGYITVVDMAGRESPTELFRTFLDDKANVTSVLAVAPVGLKAIETHIRPEIAAAKYSIKNVDEILREGFFINESINHLTYYLNKKNGKSKPVKIHMKNMKDYRKDNFFVNPAKEENQNTLNTSNRCLMIPVLNFLDNLPKAAKNTGYLPTKFVMMCMVRQEAKYCDQTFETLEFANSIKSS